MRKQLEPQIPVLDFNAAIKIISQKPQAHSQGYLAMYSSWLGGITLDPAFMQIPIDDHMVHRGDGIFEAIKVTGGKVYALAPHLDRLQRSAAAIGLELPRPSEELVDVILQTLRAARNGRLALPDALIRLYVSRGPGGFTTNPYECVGSQLYIVITAFKPLPQKMYETGVQIKWSQIAVKEGNFANIKSCNYLPNVLMKKEALDSGVDFTVSLDEKGFLAESSTENCVLISKDGEFLIPNFERTLKGITVSRMMQLAESVLKTGLITQIRQAKISLQDAHQAREMMLLGTTMDILPVIKAEGKNVGDGRPGLIFKTLLKLLRHDIATAEEMLTSF